MTVTQGSRRSGPEEDLAQPEQEDRAWIRADDVYPECWRSSTPHYLATEHYLATDIDDIPRTRLGNPKHRGRLPSEFGADKQYWEKKGVNPSKLLNDTFLNPYTGF